ncbi:hypothetical protein FKM82_000656 [Ascaphus truei]
MKPKRSKQLSVDCTTPLRMFLVDTDFETMQMITDCDLTEQSLRFCSHHLGQLSGSHTFLQSQMQNPQKPQFHDYIQKSLKHKHCN